MFPKITNNLQCHPKLRGYVFVIRPQFSKNLLEMRGLPKRSHFKVLHWSHISVNLCLLTKDPSVAFITLTLERVYPKKLSASHFRPFRIRA